jgi:hypothetical protein
MVLSRSKQEIQKNYSSLGIETLETIQYFIDLCKNPILSKGRWFYHLLLDDPDIQFLLKDKEKSLGLVQDRLREAWWIEEEDIAQEVLLYITQWKVDVTNLHNRHRVIGRALKDWILHNQKLFHEFPIDLDPKEEYINEDLQLSYKRSRPDLSHFDRYLIYLYGPLGLSHIDIAGIINTERHTLRKWVIQLQEKLKE